MNLARKLEVGSACLIIPVLLELLPASRVLRWIERIPPHAGEHITPERLAFHVARLLRRAPFLWHDTCLRRAVVLAALLRREGLAADVAIGVRRDANGAVAAHAWVRRHDGTPFLADEGVQEFTELTASAVARASAK
ncbi:MAG TPA: lasso peptide biosynthesis B2 protein [Gemmatimonadaceae bacterium]|jgi:hypothetical protein